MDKIYTLLHQDAHSGARNGILKLGHGEVQTPAFMPVGTNGTVKGVYHSTVDKMGYHLILANTYHLYLRPGTEVLEKFGGLHKFSNWNHNILTDSGGFQIFSLPGFRKITPEGINFQSHIDGSRHQFTPEKVVDVQNIIGSDVCMMLDVCTPPEISHKKATEAMKTTHAWAKRALMRRDEIEQQGNPLKGQLFGIVQGNFYKDLRIESAETISGMDFPGIAIGGLSVGEEKETFYDYLALTAEHITPEKPRYVMGIGTPDYILAAVENGIDMFDCVLQTRTARNGTVFTDHGMLNIKKAFNKYDESPIQEGCTCSACKNYSRGYLHHMFKCNEMFGGMLASEHNLMYMYSFMERIRAAIQEDRFKEFKQDFLDKFYGDKE